MSSMPDANVEWKKLGPTAHVELRGKPGTRYYVARLADGREAVVNWGGHDARQAQRWLDEQARKSARKGHGSIRRGIIGPRGVEAPLTMMVRPRRIYALGASTSPKVVYITTVTDDRIKYKVYPFHGREIAIERWIGEDLINRGSKAYLAYVAPHGDTELQAAVRESLAGGGGEYDAARWEPWEVTVFATVPKGKGREGDPWYWAEEYGGVGGRQTPDGYQYLISTDKGGHERLKKDSRFRIVSAHPREAKSGDLRRGRARHGDSPQSFSWTKPYFGIQHLHGNRALDGGGGQRRTHHISVEQHPSWTEASVLFLTGSHPFTAIAEETFRGGDHAERARAWAIQQAKALGS